MQVLLVSPNQEFLPDPVCPLGLAYLASSLQQAGHQVEVVDLCFASDPRAAIEQALHSFIPDLIGLSIRNVDNTAFPHTVSYLEYLKEIVQILRALSSAPILAGGSGFTIMPEEVLGHLGLEMGIAGEGEVSLVRFLSQRMEAEVPGLVRKKRDGYSLVPPSPVSDLDCLPLPARGLLDLSRYLQEGGACNIQSKRGCAFGCIYCTYPWIEGRVVRMRDPQRVVEEIQWLQEEWGIDYLFFVDNIFNYPPQHAEAICREILSRGLKVRWTCYAHPGYMTASLAEWMARSGCESVEFGTDSGSAPVLSALGKEFGPDQIRAASLSCREAGLEFCHSLILGGPGETRESLQETFQLMEEVDPTAVIAMIGVRVYPHTPLARMLIEEGQLQPQEIAIPPRFYLSPALGEKTVELVVDHAQNCRTWIVPGHQINYTVKLQRLFRRKGKMGPIWAYMRNLRGRGGQDKPGSREEGKGREQDG